MLVKLDRTLDSGLEVFINEITNVLMHPRPVFWYEDFLNIPAEIEADEGRYRLPVHAATVGAAVQYGTHSEEKHPREFPALLGVFDAHFT